MTEFVKTTLDIITSGAAKVTYTVLVLFAIMLTVFNSLVMPWYVNKPTVAIPDVVGMKEAEAIEILTSLNLTPLLGETRMDKRYPEGSVAAQNPDPRQIVKEGRRVYLTISGGEKLVVIPLFKGNTLRNAKFTLDRLELLQGALSYEISTDFPEGTIVSQEPTQGTKIRHHGFVNFTVSAGVSIDSILVPDLTGATLTEAQKTLLEKGLTVGTITYEPTTDFRPNTVVGQVPRPSEIVTVEKHVDLFIASPADNVKSGREN